MSAKNIVNVFKIIDNEYKAYWLGFLYADGNIGSKEDKIELSLAEKDIKHIEKFRDFIGINNKISYRQKTKAYRFSFRSQNCKEDLIDKGCFPKKSLSLKFPREEQVPSYLIRHFIRGYFDGDGWFCNTENGCLQIGLIGTEDFLKSFLHLMRGKINVNNKIFNVHRENGAKRYVFSKEQDIKTFLNYIYKNSNIYLDRKYAHYIDFIKNGRKILPRIKEI